MKPQLKIGIAIGALVVAIVVAVYTMRPVNPPGEEVKLTFTCRKCGEKTERSLASVLTAAQSGEASQGDDARWLIKCPKCGDVAKNLATGAGGETGTK